MLTVVIDKEDVSSIRKFALAILAALPDEEVNFVPETPEKKVDDLDALLEESLALRRAKRGRAENVNLVELIDAGVLKEGQAVFLLDHRGKRLAGTEATVSRENRLKFEGKMHSMSGLAKTLRQDKGYPKTETRGPKYWYTEAGRSILECWTDYQSSKR